jgi:hypothetical protein
MSRWMSSTTISTRQCVRAPPPRTSPSSTSCVPAWRPSHSALCVARWLQYSHTLTCAPAALCRPRRPARAAARERPHQGRRAGELERGASTTCARDARPSRCGSLCSWRADGRPGGRGRQEGGARTGPVRARGRAGGRGLSTTRIVIITRYPHTHILRNRSDVVTRDGAQALNADAPCRLASDQRHLQRLASAAHVADRSADESSCCAARSRPASGSGSLAWDPASRR